MNLAYYKELDGIRGIAALMVMYFHFLTGVKVADGGVIGFLVKTSVFGQTGVTLFFVLSGFLITRILLSTKSYKNYYRNFYIRRALRIFPLYYLALIFYLVIVPLLQGRDPIAFIYSWSFWFYVQNFIMTFKIPVNGPFHLWSLAVEEHFYLFWPLLVFFLSPKLLLYTLYLFIFSAIICRIVLLQHEYKVFYFTFTTIDALAIGSILALKEKSAVKAKKLLFNIFTGLVLVFFVTYLLKLLIPGYGALIFLSLKDTLVAAAFCMLLASVVSRNQNKKLHSFLLLNPLLYTGKISYGLYVYHVLCFSLVFKYFRFNNLFLNFFVCFGLSYSIATISYYLYEKRFILLKNKISVSKDFS